MCSLAAALDTASDDAMASNHPKNKADGTPRDSKSLWQRFHRSLGQRLVNARLLYCQSTFLLYAAAALDRLVVAVCVDDVVAFSVHGLNPPKFPVDYNWCWFFFSNVRRGTYGNSNDLRRVGNPREEKLEGGYCRLLKD